MAIASMSRSFIALLSILPPSLSLPVISPNDSVYTSTKPGDLQRTFLVRIATLTCSCVSMVASLVAFYWFCRMEKRFRHRLIMILVYGDLTRATWFFLYALVALARGTVRTESSFCQASGFFIQYGTETSDFGVLVIAVHSALQVFLPGSQATSDGLYPYQHHIYVGALLIPSLMAGLAFINERRGYLAQGAFCTLPIRPFWYRLALTWIPRYLIAVTIICLAIAIYTYVGYKFRSYSELSQSMQTSYGPGVTLPEAPQGERDHETTPSTSALMEPTLTALRRASSIAHDIVSSHHRATPASSTHAHPNLDRSVRVLSTNTRSLPESSVHLPLKPSEVLRPPLFMIPSGDIIQPPDFSTAPGNITPPRGIAAINRASLVQATQVGEAQSQSPSPNSSPGHRHMARQRARVNRQLRLMFIYPLVYTLMWILPFINHCMMYKDKYALQPVWLIRLGAYICMGSIGFVDCLIFSLREKPWQSISTSDGTFWGSFVFWRTADQITTRIVRGDGGSLTMERSITNSCPSRSERVRTNTRTSEGSSEISRVAAEHARLRLDLEREERLAALNARVARRRTSLDISTERACDESSSVYDDDDDDDEEEEEEEEESGQPAPAPKQLDSKGKGKAIARDG